MKEFVKKYFIPNEQNEYTPHFFRKASVVAISLIAVLVFGVGIFHTTLIQKTNLLSAVIPKVIVNLANTNRINDSLSELTINPILEDAAQRKANHMAANGYFSHNSPDGITPWYWFKQAGYEYLYAGENLAVNFADSEDVDKAWMNSPTHRSNILNGKFTEIGVATAKGMYKGRETVFVVQLFGRPLPSFAKKFISTTPSTPQSKPVTIATSTSTTTPVQQKALTPTNKVLGDSESFISITNPDVDSETEAAALAAEEENTVTTESAEDPSPAETLLASPKKAVSTLYLALASLIILALLALIFIEIKRQSPKHIAVGIILLIAVFVLLFIFREYLFTEVLVL